MMASMKMILVAVACCVIIQVTDAANCYTCSYSTRDGGPKVEGCGENFEETDEIREDYYENGCRRCTVTRYSGDGESYIIRGCTHLCEEGEVDIPGYGTATLECCNGARCNGSDVIKGSFYLAAISLFVAMVMCTKRP